MEPSLVNFAATVCRLLACDLPELASAEPLADVVDQLPTGKPVDKLFIYAPDALGRQLLRRYPKLTERISTLAPIQVELSSVFPSVTPVCFASLFTGATPEVHGLDHYEKRTLACDSLFDALVRAGKRVALVAPGDSSMSVLWRGRGKVYSPTPPWQFECEHDAPRFDLFIMQYDPQVDWCTLKLLEHCDYDVVVAYHMQYDDLLHLTGPFSPECLLAFEQHVLSFERLATAAQTAWRGLNRGVCVTPDHGAHYDAVRQMGWHGLDQPEDMELLHCWGIYPA